MILSPFLDAGGVTLYAGDCIEVMRQLPEASVDAIITDPPYGLEFMGKDWDAFAPKDRKNATVWDGRRQAQDGWQDKAKDRSGRGGAGPSYKSTHKGSKRCAKCGKRAFSGSPCKCVDPEWVVEHRQEAPSAMLGFQSFSEAWAREAYRILNPGGHLLAFGGTRTYHRLAAGIEDAGFEIRDCLAWLYGSGFPKSLDVSKAIDKQRDDRAGVYEVTAWIREARDAAGVSNSDIDAAFGFHGMAGHWTSSKSQPAVPTLDQVPQLLDVLGVSPDDVPERIRRLLLDLNGRKGQPGEAWFQREVMGERSVPLGHSFAGATYRGDDTGSLNYKDTAPATPAAEKWNGWGTALKPAFEPIVLARKPLIGTVAQNVLEHGTGALNIDACRIAGGVPSVPMGEWTQSGTTGATAQRNGNMSKPHTAGRWPANVTLDETAAAMLDEQSGQQKDGVAVNRNRGGVRPQTVTNVPARIHSHADITYGGHGGASRFFYCAKASKKDRNTNGATNTHPTVKPTSLMRWLIRLATPPGGIILDPFGGSGSTGVAARAEGVRCILIEREAEYLDIIRQRLDDGSLFGELA